MNEEHIAILSSPRWAQMLEHDVLPWVTATTDLGDHVLEVGPGPGLTTDILRRLTPKVTAVEVDPALATPLAERLADTNVDVLNLSATELPFPDRTFSAAACFAVLHHVPDADTQDRILAEVLRVLRPGGALVASEGYDNEGTRTHHEGDLFVPVDPDLLPQRLAELGYADITVDRGEYDFRFRACRPA